MSKPVEPKLFELLVCPKWYCNNFLLFDAPRLPCAKHRLDMIRDTKLRHKVRKIIYKVGELR